MEKKELVNKIKENLTRLPLSFGYLGAVKEQEENSNYNGISYKPDTVAVLQTDAEYGFWASPDELALFPPLGLDWKVPYTVTNSIIDWDDNSHFDIKQVISQLDEMGCAALQLRCYSQQPLSFFEDILLFTKTSRIKAIDLVFPWFQGLTSTDLVKLAEQYLRINSIVVHGAPFTDYIDDINNRLTRVVFTPEKVTSEHHCGLVFADYFTLNMSVFTEAHQFNSCLNRKISIDKQGQIKNCPSMAQSFGDVAITRLQAVLDQPAFTSQWDITKDDIAVCKDCEFRYVCTDCRAYTQGFNNPLGKPAACHYNPYTATWETQATGEEPAAWTLTANEQNA